LRFLRVPGDGAAMAAAGHRHTGDAYAPAEDDLPAAFMSSWRR
jgi:hypothetical protein